jgi:Glycoside hydrolase family 44
MLKACIFTAASVAASVASAQTLVYTDALGPGFQNFSWATVNFAATSPVHSGQRAIEFQPDNFQGLYFAHPAQAIAFSTFTGLRMWVHGGSAGNQNISVNFQLGNAVVYQRPLSTFTLGGPLASGVWREVWVPFSGANAPSGTFDGIILQDQSGLNQAAVYVDDVVLESSGVTPTAARLSIHLNGTRRAINPNIYGVNFGSDAQHADLRYPTRRWGGNRTSRYNWQFDVDNTAADYFFQNIAFGDGSNLPTNSFANQFVIATKAHGGDALVSVPTIGWVAKDSRTKLWSFSQNKYGAQSLDECRYYAPNPPFWCSADAGNGRCVAGMNCQNGVITNNDPLDTGKAVGPSYAADWVTHLRSVHGNANAGGVKYYALDNEAMLWNSTHRDVHPSAPSMQEVWTRGLARAQAIRSVESNAQIFGPVTWGWCDYFSSAADAALGNCFDGPDRIANGGLPFVEWYLQQACAQTPRTIDFLDLHYYPQADNVSGVDNEVAAAEQPAVQAKRMRSLREMYDPNYVSESWMGQTAYPIPNFLPHARAAIAARCPGVKLALTEYKWGPDNGHSSAIAQAELLAIFGREGVDYATRWIAPDVGTLSEHAFRLYLDYDGNNSRVTGDSVPASSSDGEMIGVYAVEQSASKLFVVVINRSNVVRDAILELGGLNASTYSAYRLTGSGYSTLTTAQNASGTELALNGMPGLSATLLVVNRAGLNPQIFANGFE